MNDIKLGFLEKFVDMKVLVCKNCNNAVNELSVQSTSQKCIVVNLQGILHLICCCLFLHTVILLNALNRSMILCSRRMQVYTRMCTVKAKLLPHKTCCDVFWALFFSKPYYEFHLIWLRGSTKGFYKLLVKLSKLLLNHFN